MVDEKQIHLQFFSSSSVLRGCIYIGGRFIALTISDLKPETQSDNSNDEGKSFITRPSLKGKRTWRLLLLFYSIIIIIIIIREFPEPSQIISLQNTGEVTQEPTYINHRNI